MRRKRITNISSEVFEKKSAQLDVVGGLVSIERFACSLLVIHVVAYV